MTVAAGGDRCQGRARHDIEVFMTVLGARNVVTTDSSDVLDASNGGHIEVQFGVDANEDALRTQGQVCGVGNLYRRVDTVSP